jgi:uncharacterized membrane protein YqiK
MQSSVLHLLLQNQEKLLNNGGIQNVQTIHQMSALIQREEQRKTRIKTSSQAHTRAVLASFVSFTRYL